MLGLGEMQGRMIVIQWSMKKGNLDQGRVSIDLLVPFEFLLRIRFAENNGLPIDELWPVKLGDPWFGEERDKLWSKDDLIFDAEWSIGSIEELLVLLQLEVTLISIFWYFSFSSHSTLERQLVNQSSLSHLSSRKINQLKHWIKFIRRTKMKQKKLMANRRRS